ncbi:MAG: hypothetical protein Q9226_003421 [Calogaya cf. arnoldii]
MRLRLTVQRHGLPPARVLWTIGAVHPPHSAAGPEPTVAQLLEQVNEIIPLESGDWGLEDYAVEVGGFECLHFSGTSQVLKEDDEVWPLLRRANRPAIHIPPRKRRRLTYDEDDEEDFEADSQIVVHSGSKDESSSPSGSDDSEGSAIASDEEEDLLTGLIAEDEEAGVDTQQLSALSTRRPRKARGLGLITSSLLVDENGKPYPETYDNPLLDMFADDESVERAASPECKKPGGPGPASRQRRSRRHHPGVETSTPSMGSGKSPGENGKIVPVHESEFDTPATVRLESSDDSGDDDFEPSDDIGMAEEESDKENATPGSQASTDIGEAAELAAKIDSSIASESDSATDDTSSSGSSSSDSSSSDSESEHASRTRLGLAERDQETLSSGSSSSDSTSSSSEDAPSSSSILNQTADKQTRKENISSMPIDDCDEPDHDESQESRKLVPHGAGRRETQTRNQRRKNHKKLLRLQKSGKLPSTATTADVHALEAAPFEARRQALLKAISSGGVDVENDPALDQASIGIGSRSPTSSPHSSAMKLSKTTTENFEKFTASLPDKTLVDVLSTAEPGMDRVTGSTRDRNEESVVDIQGFGQDSQTHIHASPSLPVNEDITAAAKPRMKLDMDSSRRLLFGALGHRAPKSKEDEVKLQEKLMKDARTLKKPPPQTVGDLNELVANSLALPDDNIRWQDKIELSAVECCHDGIELSTPPFPFVQRWDPQQQRGYGPGQTGFSQKSKKRKRNNRNYEASFEPVEDDTALDPKPRIANDVGARFDDNTNGSSAGPVPIDRIASDENLKAANDQLLWETEETSGDVHKESDPPEDLPQLPEDVSALPDLKQAACSAGMIIAYKQLDMSAATNWQPLYSPYRTALVDSVLDDGTLLVKMALRDQPSEERQYHPDTGERIYTKFEMPGYHENESNNGLRELAFGELIDPKLIQAPEKRPEDIDEPPSGASLDVNERIKDNDQQATHHQSPIPSNKVVQQVLKHTRDPQKDAEVAEQVRKDIHDLITEAGWRSSIQANESIRQEVPDDSRVNQDHGMDYEMDQIHQGSEAPGSTPYQAPSSPRFNGFNSSPPAEPDQEVEDQVKYPNLRGTSSELYDGATDDPDRTMADTSSQADMEAMQAIREDFEKELNRPAASKNSARHLDSSRLSAPPLITSQEADHENTSPAAETYPYINTIPDSQPPPSEQPATYTSSLLKNKRDHENSSHPSSDNNDLPSLSTVFTSFNSQRASSISNNKEVKPEHHSSSSDEAFMSTLPSHKPKLKSINKKSNNKPPASSAPARTSNINNSNLQSTKQSKSKLATLKRPNKYEAAPRSSQDWIGTQVVDLTMSSDPIDFSMEENFAPRHDYIKDEDDDDDDFGVLKNDSLPKGEGWVRKNKGMTGKKALVGFGGGKGRR